MAIAPTALGYTGKAADGGQPVDAVEPGAAASSQPVNEAMASTFNYPQWQGQLYYLTREITPFFSAVGGMGNGRTLDKKEFVFQIEQGEDSTANNARPEGWTPEDERVYYAAQRQGVTEIHQHSIALTYTRDAVTGQIGAGGSGRTGALAPNDEGIVEATGTPMLKAINQKLRKIGRDLEKTALYGTYFNPETQPVGSETSGFSGTYDPNAVRKAQGFLDYLLIGAGKTNPTPLIPGADITAVQMDAAAAQDTEDPFFGAKIDVAGGDLWRDGLNDLLVQLFEADTEAPMMTPVLWMNGSTKVQLSKEYTNNFGLADRSRTVGGVNIETIITDFGTFGVALDRYLPKNIIALADMSYLNPVTLPTRNKGVFFTEPLAKTGAYERMMIYGEIGFEYGPRSYHGIIANNVV
ncbi:MAG: hypothetical protein DRH08_01255 [Deltaproteobacteria bacterium]|nr:MAG: hypothetical protein DRH08_01255 [Deltaproteobacteria bacterium]